MVVATLYQILTTFLNYVSPNIVAKFKNARILIDVPRYKVKDNWIMSLSLFIVGTKMWLGFVAWRAKGRKINPWMSTWMPNAQWMTRNQPNRIEAQLFILGNLLWKGEVLYSSLTYNKYFCYWFPRSFLHPSRNK